MKTLVTYVLVFAILGLGSVLADPNPSASSTMNSEEELWLQQLNAQPGRESPLTAQQVIFYASNSDDLGQVVAAGFPQTDATVVLGAVLWRGKLYTPLAGAGSMLGFLGFRQADDATRLQLFLKVLNLIDRPLGIHPYTGPASAEPERPQPITGSRQANGTHRFTVWFYQEPGQREGGEWRQVLYLIDPLTPAITARTLVTFHPVAEGLQGFPKAP